MYFSLWTNTRILHFKMAMTGCLGHNDWIENVAEQAVECAKNHEWCLVGYKKARCSGLLWCPSAQGAMGAQMFGMAKPSRTWDCLGAQVRDGCLALLRQSVAKDYSNTQMWGRSLDLLDTHAFGISRVLRYELPLNVFRRFYSGDSRMRRKDTRVLRATKVLEFSRLLGYEASA